MKGLTALQTRVLELLVQERNTSPIHTLAAIHSFLVLRAGCSDEDTMHHLQLLVDRSLITPTNLPSDLAVRLGYKI